MDLQQDRPKIIVKFQRRDLFAFDLGHKDIDSFLDASGSKACLSFEEFCSQQKLVSKKPAMTANDYLAIGFNAAATGQRQLPHKKAEIEALRLKLSLLTFSNDVESIKSILLELESLGLRIFWPEIEKDMKDSYEIYLENIRFQEYMNRRIGRLYAAASPEEKQLM